MRRTYGRGMEVRLLGARSARDDQGSRCLGGSTQKRHINARPSAFEDARVLALKTRAMTAFGLLAV